METEPRIRKKAGRKRAFDTRKEERARALFLAGEPIPAILEALGISHATLYRYRAAWRSRVLTVGVLDCLGETAQRYNRFPAGSSPGHHDVQVIRALAQKLDMRVRFKPVAFPQLLEGVLAGRFDLGVGQLGESRARRQRFRLSTPYSNLGDGPNMALVAPRMRTELSLENRASLRGCRIATLRESLCEEWLQAQAATGLIVVPFSRPSAIVQAMLRRRVEACLQSYPDQQLLVARHPELEIKRPLISHGGRKALMLVQPEHALLHEQLDEALDALMRDGTLAQLER